MEKILIKKLKSLSNPEAIEGMARFGINPKNTYGVSIPALRKVAKEIRKNHLLAQRLWNSGVHEARDERNFVKKAVNWALRQIGKRNLGLNQMAIRTAKEIHGIDSKAAKWIASDAIRELTSEAVQKKLRMK